MAGQNLKERSPTASKLKNGTEASKAMKKKLYRKRTMEEVKRGIHQVENSYDDGNPENQDPAHKTIDLAVDSARTTGDVIEERVSTYSQKLKETKAGDEAVKSSGKLKNVGESAAEASASGSSQTASTASSTASNSASKQLQKQQIKREYARAARNAETGAKASGKAAGEAGKAGKKTAEKTTDLVSKALEKAGEFIAEHPLGCLIGLLAVIILLVVMSSFSSVGMAFGGMGGGTMGGSYTAKDSDILGAEADYCAKETELQNRINNIRSTYSGYDEYNINVASIGHDPYQLASYLSVKYVDYKRNRVGSDLNSIFDYQYTFTVQSVTETRYRTEERTGYYSVPDYDEEGNITGYTYYSYTYYVQVPYDYYILNVTLTNDGIDGYFRADLSDDDYARYQYMNATHGSRDGMFN